MDIVLGQELLQQKRVQGRKAGYKVKDHAVPGAGLEVLAEGVLHQLLVVVLTDEEGVCAIPQVRPVDRDQDLRDDRRRDLEVDILVRAKPVLHDQAAVEDLVPEERRCPDRLIVRKQLVNTDKVQNPGRGGRFLQSRQSADRTVISHAVFRCSSRIGQCRLIRRQRLSIFVTFNRRPRWTGHHA